MSLKIPSISISPETRATARDVAIAAVTTAAAVAAVALPVFKVCFPFLLPFLVAAAPWVLPVVVIVAAIGISYGAYRLHEYINAPEQSKPKQEKIAPSPSLSEEHQTPPRAAGLRGERPMPKDIEPVYKELLEISETTPEELKIALNIKGSEGDAGGHGGMFTAIFTTKDGKKHPLFLKPKDAVEARGYEVIEFLHSKLLGFMPHFYGEITIGGKTFIVMQNTRITKDGRDVRPDADMKLAGKINREIAKKLGLAAFNPIADQEEWKKTRGKEKPRLVAKRMYDDAEASPDYMIAIGHKLERFLHYPKSEENFKKILETWNIDECVSFKARLVEMREQIKESPIAFIGASILSVDRKPYFIDPAHIVVDPEKQEELKAEGLEVDKIYFGDTEGKRFNLYKESNIVAIGAIIATVEGVIKRKHNSDASIDPTSPSYDGESEEEDDPLAGG